MRNSSRCVSQGANQCDNESHTGALPAAGAWRVKRPGHTDSKRSGKDYRQASFPFRVYLVRSRSTRWRNNGLRTVRASALGRDPPFVDFAMLASCVE